MKRQYNQGAATLLITSLLLIAALVLSFASYKIMFYQIKQAQNEVKARQAHWLAEAGIECAYAYIHAFPDKLFAEAASLETSINQACNPEANLDVLSITPIIEKSYLIAASHANYQISRRFYYREVIDANSAEAVKEFAWHLGGWNGE